MDTGERLGDDGTGAQMTRFQGGMFAGRALAVVLIADSDPVDALRLVEAGNIRHSGPFARHLVLDLVHFVVFDVGGTVAG